MGIIRKILLICVYHGATDAFFVPAPKAGPKPFSFSYLKGRARLWKRSSASLVHAGRRVPTIVPTTDEYQPEGAPNQDPSGSTEVASPFRYDVRRRQAGGNSFREYGGFEVRPQQPQQGSRNEVAVQGGSRKTFRSAYGSERQRVYMKTEGRPLDATFAVYDGPDNTPTKVKVYSEDGGLRPFNAMIGTRGRSGSSTVSIRNNGGLAFPMSGGTSPVSRSFRDSYGGGGLASTANMKTIQGKSLKTWSLDHSVGSVEVSITTDGMPMHAVVELWGVGGHVKQVASIYNDDGYSRPFSAIVDTPGHANTICIRNTGPVAFPLRASVDIRSKGSFY